MKLLAWLRPRLEYWGARLGVLAAAIAGYLATNGSAVEKAIDGFVPEQYRPVAGVLVGLISFLIINATSTLDARKVAGQWQR